MRERHILLEGESVIVKVGLACDRGVWGVTNTNPVIVLWWLCKSMPLCTTLSPIVKYFYKCTRRYYVIAGIEELHYLKYKKIIS